MRRLPILLVILGLASTASPSLGQQPRADKLVKIEFQINGKPVPDDDLHLLLTLYDRDTPLQTIEVLRQQGRFVIASWLAEEPVLGVKVVRGEAVAEFGRMSPNLFDEDWVVGVADGEYVNQILSPEQIAQAGCGVENVRYLEFRRPTRFWDRLVTYDSIPEGR
jgi:hypothetical protein